MKVAVFIKDNELTVLNEEKVHVVVFNFEENKVVGVEHKVLENQTKESIQHWLNHKTITQIYLSEIDEQFHHKLKAKGISVRTLEDLRNDKLYNSLALTTPKAQGHNVLRTTWS